MESVRLPRFTRVKQITPPQLTARDREIIRRVFEHRFLRSTHIHALIGGSRQQLLRRLQRLYHHGYLERPRAQIDYYHQGGSHSMVYGLGHTGAALLKRELNLPFHRLDWSAKNQEVKQLFLEHALLTADVMVAFELACRRHGDVRLISASELSLPAETRRHREPFHWQVITKHQLKLGAQPDRVFALEFPDLSRAYFFLEADRATMPVIRLNFEKSSFYRKLLAYEATWTQNLHRSRFGFHRFRVLTVTTSAERVKHLIEAGRQLERGQGLFLFTDLASLLAHGDILTLPWQTCQPGKTENLT
jgi:DNA-binding Lrp family transcriptional regulator